MRSYKARNRKSLAAASRQYYAEHKTESLARQKRIYHAFKEQMGIVKAFVGCQGCGWHPETLDEAKLLDWHHRDPATKLFKVCLMHSRSLQVVNDEIAKCDVLCQTCHRAAHYA